MQRRLIVTETTAGETKRVQFCSSVAFVLLPTKTVSGKKSRLDILSVANTNQPLLPGTTVVDPKTLQPTHSHNTCRNYISRMRDIYVTHHTQLLCAHALRYSRALPPRSTRTQTPPLNSLYISSVSTHTGC